MWRPSRLHLLGPLLFIIFINDLPLFLPNTVYSPNLYADDTTIYDIQNDLLKLKSNLQSSLHSLREWCVRNGILLNAEKTKVMLITTRQRRLHIDESILSLTYNDTNLHITTGDKMLGVNIEENLQWNSLCLNTDRLSQPWKKRAIIHQSFVTTAPTPPLPPTGMDGG